MSVLNQQSQKSLRQVVIGKEEISSDATWVCTLPNEFDFIDLYFSGLTPATDNTALFLRVRDYGATSTESGASDYAWAYSSQLAATGAVDLSDASDSEIQLALAVGSTTTESCTGHVRIMDFADQAISGNVAKLTTVKFNTTVINATPGYVDYTGSGWRLAAERSDQVELLFASGDIESGTVVVVGNRVV
tara:strand:+ start:1002 stop:1571 length:570 start_codon:yes stop_codon:yes gene_type:complete